MHFYAKIRQFFKIRQKYAFLHNIFSFYIRDLFRVTGHSTTNDYIITMDFFTKVDTPAASFNIDYTSHLAFFGSCFADKISAQFAARKFDVFANPFGTVYNPASIERQIKAIAEEKIFGEGDVFQDTRSDKLWHSWDAHGSLSGATREECIAKMNEAATRTREFLQKADVVFITLGTALVYFLKDALSGSGNIHGCAVSNCHRQDPRIFEHRMITVEEAAESIRGIVESLRTIAGRNPHIVLTVSPLRHTGDGAHGNTLSKATLQLAAEKAIAGMQASANSVSYFPSYEIVMDELRDYRFYADDMIHLSNLRKHGRNLLQRKDPSRHRPRRKIHEDGKPPHHERGFRHRNGIREKTHGTG